MIQFFAQEPIVLVVTIIIVVSVALLKVSSDLYKPGKNNYTLS